MKDLNYHKKQVELKRSSNRFQQWANKAVDEVCKPILAASQERRDRMLKELQLQRCKLEISITKREWPTLKQVKQFRALAELSQRLFGKVICQ